jgi:hypothetical protein
LRCKTKHQTVPTDNSPINLEAATLHYVAGYRPLERAKTP